MDVVATRAASARTTAASRPYSSGTRPATALSPTLGSGVALEHPDVAAVVQRLDVRRHLGGLLRQAALEEVGRLDDVVVDAHQDQIVDLHCGPPRRECDSAVRLGQMDGTSIVRRPPFGSNPLVGERGSDTQRKILGAALEVFAEVGFNEARVELITKRAGCSRPAFYQYFSSKDDVFWQLAGQLGHEMVQLGHRLDPVTPDADGIAALDGVDRRVHGALRAPTRPVFSAFQAASRDHEPMAAGVERHQRPPRHRPAARLRRSRAAAAATSRSPRSVVAVLIRCSFYWRTPRGRRRPRPARRRAWPSSSTGSSPARSTA